MHKQLVVVLLFAFSSIYSQVPAYFGAGNDSLVTVHSSSFLSDTIWPFNPVPENTINGKGLLSKHEEASRFLMQASLGFEEHHIEDVVDLGIESWIDSQIVMTPSYVSTGLDTIFQITIDTLLAGNGNDSTDIPVRPNYVDLNYAWWNNNMKNEDLLRHKMAAALSEIFVISRQSALKDYGYGLGSYYDVLVENALGNYEDLLTDVTLHPMMGWYLTFVKNPKTDTVAGIYPDENYAREVMQLFSIGLMELNLDGTPKLDSLGEEIPTYTNQEVSEFAKIFTGLGYGDVYPFHAANGKTNSWNLQLFHADMSVPMMMYEEHHEPGQKFLLNDFIVPSDQTGMEDIEDAISNIFNHENVGPFIAYRLIQRLVKSNPSPAYVERVATIFNDNGSGVRGDLAAVAKAILLDDEARLCAFQNVDTNSKLKEPLFRYSHFARMIDLQRLADDYYWNNSNTFYQYVLQDIMSAPSVFNFFMYNDAPNGPIKDAGLVAPEYQLHTTQTSVAYWNRVNKWVNSSAKVLDFSEQYMTEKNAIWDKSDFDPIYDDTEVYLNWLDLNFTAGQMSERTRAIIRNALNELYVGTYQKRDRIWLGAYLALISPEANIMR